MVPLAGYAPAADHYQWPALLLSDRGKALITNNNIVYTMLNYFLCNNNVTSTQTAIPSFSAV